MASLIADAQKPKRHWRLLLLRFRRLVRVGGELVTLGVINTCDPAADAFVPILPRLSSGPFIRQKTPVSVDYDAIGNCSSDA